MSEQNDADERGNQISVDHLQEKDGRLHSPKEKFCEGDTVVVQFYEGREDNGEKRTITGTIVSGGHRANPSGGLKGHRFMLDVDEYDELVKVRTDRYNGFEAPVWTGTRPETFDHELFGDDARVFSEREWDEYQQAMYEAEQERKIEKRRERHFERGF